MGDRDYRGQRLCGTVTMGGRLWGRYDVGRDYGDRDCGDRDNGG